MVRARRVMVRDPPGDRGLVAPRHEAVDEPVAPTVLHVPLVEPEAQEVVDVVRESQVDGEVRAGDRPGGRRVGVQHHRLLGGQQRAVPEDGAGLVGVLGRHQVRVGAEAAVAANPRDAEGHFSLARAIGRKALTVGVRDRIHFAKIVRAEALEALKDDSAHAGALHVLGIWNAEILRVNGLARLFAKSFLGAGVFGLASWGEAQRLLERSVQLDPNRIVHHLDLGAIYADSLGPQQVTPAEASFFEAVGHLLSVALRA